MHRSSMLRRSSDMGLGYHAAGAPDQSSGRSKAVAQDAESKLSAPAGLESQSPARRLWDFSPSELFCVILLHRL